MQLLRISLILSAMAILISCSMTSPVRTDIDFKPKSVKVPKSVIIKISPDTKNYVAEADYAGATWRVPVGQALEPNALKAFGTVFEEVTAENGTVTIDRMIEMSFGSETGIHLGALTFSENTFIVELKCKIKDSAGKVVWSATTSAEASERSAAGLLGGIAGTYAYRNALGKATDAALEEALQNLVNQIAAEREVIF